MKSKPRPTQDKVLQAATELTRQFGCFRRAELINRVRTVNPELTQVSISTAMYKLLTNAEITRGKRNSFRVPGILSQPAKAKASSSSNGNNSGSKQDSKPVVSWNLWTMFRNMISTLSNDNVKSSTGQVDGVTLTVERSKAV